MAPTTDDGQCHSLPEEVQIRVRVIAPGGRCDICLALLGHSQLIHSSSAHASNNCIGISFSFQIRHKLLFTFQDTCQSAGHTSLLRVNQNAHIFFSIHMR
jgi:hypothetical protein